MSNSELRLPLEFPVNKALRIYWHRLRLYLIVVLLNGILLTMIWLLKTLGDPEWWKSVSQNFMSPVLLTVQPSWFDWAILIPYFTMLIVLSVYGLHKYDMIRTYFKYHKGQACSSPGHFQELPSVTVQLPIYNELYVFKRLLDEVVKLDYPRNRLQVQVLDDSTDETALLAKELVELYRNKGIPIEYYHRNDRYGFKAEALQEGLKTATGELIAIFDADFCPPSDFLRRTVHYFTDPKVGAVQTRWSYLNRHYSLLTEVEALLLDGHFILENGSRFRAGYFFSFNGAGSILRRQMIDDSGGWHHDTITADSDLSYRAQLKGWRFIYLPNLDCPSELPIEMSGFQNQQSRWAKGLTQVARKLLPTILRADIPKRVKAEAFLHLTMHLTYPLLIAIFALCLPAMIIRFEAGWWQLVFIDLPLTAASFMSIALFYIVSQKELYPQKWRRSILLLPLVIAVEVGQTIINTRAVLEALFGIRTPYVRTPKYAVSDDRIRGHWKYRSTMGWLPFLEIAFGTYFLVLIVFAVQTYNIMLVPFLVLFALGFYWVGYCALIDQYRMISELWSAVALESETRNARVFL